MTTAPAIDGWFRGRIGDGWFDELEVRVDRDEVLVVGTLPPPALAADGDDDARRHAALARIDGFR